MTKALFLVLRYGALALQMYVYISLSATSHEQCCPLAPQWLSNILCRRRTEVSGSEDILLSLALLPNGRLSDPAFVRRVHSSKKRYVVISVTLLSLCLIHSVVYAIYSEYRNYFICLRIFRVFNFALVSFTTVSTLRILSYDGACLVGNIPWHVACFG